MGRRRGTRRGGSKWYERMFGSTKVSATTRRDKSVINNTSIDELTSGLHKTNSKVAKMQEALETHEKQMDEKIKNLKSSINDQIAHVMKELEKKANISQVVDVDE